MSDSAKYTELKEKCQEIMRGFGHEEWNYAKSHYGRNSDFFTEDSKEWKATIATQSKRTPCEKCNGNGILVLRWSGIEKTQDCGSCRGTGVDRSNRAFKIAR